MIFREALATLIHSNYYDVLKFSTDMKQGQQLLFIRSILLDVALASFSDLAALTLVEKHGGSAAVMN
jgi:hypothetical protein